MQYIRTTNGIEKLTDEQVLEKFPPKPKNYIEKRQEAYGSVEQQIEFITENGLGAWQQKVFEIKANIPKPKTLTAD